LGSPLLGRRDESARGGFGIWSLVCVQCGRAGQYMLLRGPSHGIREPSRQGSEVGDRQERGRRRRCRDRLCAAGVLVYEVFSAKHEAESP
jgi:hypothetical protein